MAPFTTIQIFIFILLNVHGVKSNTSTFIASLVNSKYSHCSLFMFRDGFDKENQNLLSEIVDQTQLPMYNVRYRFPEESQISAFIEAEKQFNLPSRNISEALGSSSSLPLSFPIRVSNYRKRSDQCLMVIFFLRDIRSQFIKQIFNLITPVYIPITRKDEDYYIFITPPNQMNKLLLMNELPARIKFKIAIGEDEDRHELVVKTVCFFCLPGGQPEILDWTRSTSGKYLDTFEYFPDFVIDLNGKILKVSCPYIRARIEADPPFVGINNARRGIWKLALEEFLMPKFNFSYHIFVSTDEHLNFGGGGTGLQLPNGTWTGVTGDLMTGRADLGVETANTPKRILAIDFTNSFLDFGYLTFVTSEGSRVYSPAAIMWPFDLVMWICITISTLVAFLFFFIIIKCIFLLGLGDHESLKFARRGQVSQQVWTFKYQIQFIITSYVDQDCVMPIFTPLRVFVAIWLFFTLVLTTIYRTKLVSFMAFPLLAALPETFDELAYSDYSVGFMKHGDSAFNTLAASTEPVYVKLVKEMEIVTGYGLECLEKVINGKHACIVYDFSLRHLKQRNLTEQESRKLVEAPAHTYNVVFGLATEGKSIFRMNMGKWISYTRAFHFGDLWEEMDMYDKVRKPKRQWWTESNQTDKLSKTDFVESEDLTLKHISGAFFILGMCLAVGFAVFIAELGEHHRRRLVVILRRAWNDLKKTD